MDPVIKKLAEIVAKQQVMIKKLAQQRSLEDAMRDAAEHPELHNSAPGLRSAPGLSSNPQMDDTGPDIGKVAPAVRPAQPAATPIPAADRQKYLPVDVSAALKQVAKANGDSKGKFNQASLKYISSVKKSPDGSMFHFTVSSSQLKNAYQTMLQDPTKQDKLDKAKGQILNQDAKVRKMLELAVQELNQGKPAKYDYKYL